MIPLATTTVTIGQPAAHEPFEPAGSVATVTAGAPAHISSPTGAERAGDAGLERVDAVLLTDADVDRGQTVTDATTGLVYRVAWVTPRTGLGLDHTRAGLVRTAGGGPQ